MSQKTISLIIPVYNEQENLLAAFKEIRKVIENSEYHFEIICVDDGSNDHSLKILQDIAKEDERIKIIAFSRNFGKSAAIHAGIDFSKGDALIVMDADLQHPPNLIPHFLEKWKEGIFVVVGKRKVLKGETWFRKISSVFYHGIMKSISSIDIERGATDFRLLDRRVAEEIKRFPKRMSSFRGLVDWLGFEQEFIEFSSPRVNKCNSSSFSLTALSRLAVESIIHYSLFPLRIAGYLGAFITIFSTLLLSIMLYVRYIQRNLTYFSSLSFIVVSNVLLSGITLVCLGLIALYIGSIHEDVSGRPSYVIKKKINFHKYSKDEKEE